MQGRTEIYAVLVIVTMIVLAFAVPWEWRISSVVCDLPLGWVIGPTVLGLFFLNPMLMTFSF
jgi:hypothetical protein